MATFEEDLSTIQTSIYGKEIKTAIADALDHILRSLLQPMLNLDKSDKKLTELENERRD